MMSKDCWMGKWWMGGCNGFLRYTKNATTPPYYTQEMVDEKQTQVFLKFQIKTT